jgi:hypothetical protein
MSIIIPELIYKMENCDNNVGHPYFYMDTLISLVIKDRVYYITVEYLTNDDVNDVIVFNTDIKSVDNNLNISYVSDEYICLHNSDDKLIYLFDRITENIKYIDVTRFSSDIFVECIHDNIIYLDNNYFKIYQYNIDTKECEIWFNVDNISTYIMFLNYMIMLLFIILNLPPIGYLLIMNILKLGRLILNVMMTTKDFSICLEIII